MLINLEVDISMKFYLLVKRCHGCVHISGCDIFSLLSDEWRHQKIFTFKNFDSFSGSLWQINVTHLANRLMNVSASETDHTSLNYKTPPAGGVTEPSGCLLSFSWNLRKQHMTQSALLLYSEDSMTCFYGSTQWMTRQSEELIMRCTLFSASYTQFLHNTCWRVWKVKCWGVFTNVSCLFQS